MLHKFLLLVFIFSCSHIFCQSSITISEGTLKVAGISEHELYFGLLQGDELVFNYEEVKGKELKEIEILELPDASKLFEYKSKSIKDKSIQIQNTGIYKLRLKNTALGGRICNYKLERVPADSSDNFNTTVYWETKRDTTYYTIEEDYLVSIDTAIVSIIPNKVERVHSQTSSNGLPNRSTVQVTLPKNTVSWSYYLGVGEDAEDIFRKVEEKANKRRKQLKAASTFSKALATFDPSGSAAMSSLALNGVVEFVIPDKANNIQYWFVSDYNNAQLFMNNQQYYLFEKGDGPLCYKRMELPKSGTFYICLLNDNLMEGIDVHIRVSAVTVSENWGKRTVEKFTINTWKEPYLKN